MTKQKSTKRALLSSAIALFVCVAMLIGTTFAWFTDSVTSKGNIIKSGTLDIEMYWAKGTEDPAAQATSWEDASKGTIFNYDKWEPGYVEARHIKIANEGTLALKYKLNVLATGEVSKLAEVIDVYYLDPAKKLEDRDALTAANKIGSLKDVLANVATTATGSLEAKKSVSITIALKMREEAGNEYQGLSIGSEFAIQLLATQYTSEDDSFDDQYDKNAAFSIWDGTVPSEMPKTLVVDADKETIFVKDAAAFAYLNTLSAEWADLYTDGNGRAYSNYANGKGAVYYYSGDWTVSLESDIDLNNHPIDPVNIMIGERTGDTLFNGNGHVIRNINTTTGLFADGTNASFSNLTLENVKATRGALIGFSRSSVSNVIVKKANISGADYVGGLIGSLCGNVYNCQVLDSNVVASGKEAGGLVGYAEASTNTIIANNLVKNVTVYANNRAAGLIAQPNVNVKVYNNTVDTVTVGAEDLTKYAAGAIVSNALDSKNVYDNTVINANILGEFTIAESDAELSNAVANGDDVVMANDVTLTGKVITTNGINEAYGNKVGVAQYGGTLDGNGNTLTETGSSAYVIVTHGGTIKNLTIVGGGRGIVIYAPTEDVIIDNVFIDGPGYAINTAEHNGQDLIVTNSTVNGWTSLAGLDSVSFTNCLFGENSTKCWQNYGYGADYDRLIRPYGQTNFTDCTFEKNFYIDLSSLANGNTVTLTNCNCEGVVLTAENYANYITVELPDWATSIADCIVFN